MTKSKSFKKPSYYDDDGMKARTVKDIKRDKDRKKERNFGNALRSKNLDMLTDYEDD